VTRVSARSGLVCACVCVCVCVCVGLTVVALSLHFCHSVDTLLKLCCYSVDHSLERVFRREQARKVLNGFSPSKCSCMEVFLLS
jgi:hypothetical protein